MKPSSKKAALLPPVDQYASPNDYENTHVDLTNKSRNVGIRNPHNSANATNPSNSHSLHNTTRPDNRPQRGLQDELGAHAGEFKFKILSKDEWRREKQNKEPGLDHRRAPAPGNVDRKGRSHEVERRARRGAAQVPMQMREPNRQPARIRPQELVDAEQSCWQNPQQPFY